MQLIPLSMLYGQSAIGTRISGSGALACHVSRRPFDGSHDDLRTYMKLSVCTVTHTHTHTPWQAPSAAIHQCMKEH